MEGAFPDSQIYAGLARSMAEGQGSFWKPAYQQNSWVSAIENEAFYVHPPLQFWLQSGFYRVLGTHWATERIYCGVILLFSIGLIVVIWRKMFAHDPQRQGFAWIAVLLWYLTPTVQWGMPYAMLEGTMGVFCLAALAVLLHSPRGSWLVLSGLLVCSACLTKGLAGLFPLAAPFFMWVFLPQKRPLTLVHACIPALTTGLFFLFLALYEPSRQFFTYYFELQLSPALDYDTYQQEKWSGRWAFVEILLSEALPVLIPAVLLVLWAWIRTKKVHLPDTHSLFALLVFLSASLPLVVSYKQHIYYLMPAAPWLAIAVTAWIAPVWPRISFRPRQQTYLHAALFLALLLVLGYTVTRAGKPEREKQLIHFVHQIQAEVRENEGIMLCREMEESYTLHSYLWRYGNWPLSSDSLRSGFQYAISGGLCSGKYEIWLQEKGWQLKKQAGPWQLWQKVPLLP